MLFDEVIEKLTDQKEFIVVYRGTGPNYHPGPLEFQKFCREYALTWYSIWFVAKFWNWEKTKHDCYEVYIAEDGTVEKFGQYDPITQKPL